MAADRERTTLRIRQASLAELPDVAALAHAIWPVAYTHMLPPGQVAYMLEWMYDLAVLEAQVREHGNLYLLAEHAGTAVGFAGYEHHHGGAMHTRLHKLYVLPGMQGSGIGHSLLLAVAAVAIGAGDVSLELNVNRRNPALQWYLRRGFTIIRDEVIDIGGGYMMDDHVLAANPGDLLA